MANIATDIASWNVVNLTSWTKLYAGNSWFTIGYIWLDWEEQSSFVWAYKNIEYKNSIEIISITWDAYISWKDTILNWEEIRSQLWLPIFEWLNLEIPFKNNFNESSYIETIYYDETRTNIDFREIDRYEIFNLGQTTNDYLIKVNILNDYYYARLMWFKNQVFGTKSSKILLSPQKEADSNSPELLTSSPIRIPVYQTKNIDLTPYIYDDAGIRNISNIYIDFDLDVDSDGDWIQTNDIETDKINITKSLISINVDFWPYDNLFKKNIWITLIDENGNVWFSELPFEVYSPVPQINAFSWWIVEWYIDEALTWEPVNLYRYRWGLITKLEDTTWTWKAITDNWAYNFNVSDIVKWLSLTYNWTQIATIDENTWKINTTWPLTAIKVVASNDSQNSWIYPEIVIYNWFEKVYHQQIKMLWDYNFEVVSWFSDITEDGIYLRFSDKLNYNYYKLPENAEFNPWVLAIHRSSSPTKEALFTIFPDWRINVINKDDFELEYWEFNDYIVLKLKDKKFNREVAQVMYKINSNYIMK